MTKKDLFYTKLHGRLAKKLGLTISQVSTIRSMVLGDGKTKDEVKTWMEFKLTQPRRQPRSLSNNRKNRKILRRGKSHYQQVIDFICLVNPTDWESLTKIYVDEAIEQEAMT